MANPELTWDFDNYRIIIKTDNGERAIGGTPIAAEIPIADAANHFTATHVEGALTELAGRPAGGLTHFSESRNVEAPNTIVPVHALATQGAESDIDAAILPKGAGAIVAQVPDGTVNTGNKRGAHAVDLQRVRTEATDVASGRHAVIAGGRSNTASGDDSAVGGGSNHNAWGAGSTIGGGASNAATGGFATVSGGGNNSSTSSFTTVGGGSSNHATGILACIGGGVNNWAQGQETTIAGGNLNFAGGQWSAIPGGYYGTDRAIQGRLVYASGRFSITGDAQICTQVQRVATMDATASILTSAGTAPSNTNTAVLPDNHAYAVGADVIARDTVNNLVKRWKIEGTAKRGTGISSVALVGTPMKTVIGEDMGTEAWNCDLVVNTSRGSVEVQVFGAAATSIHWVGRIATAEAG